MNTIILVPVILAFLTTFLISPVLMKWFSSIKLTDIDQNKKNKPLIPTSHGIAILAGTYIGTFAMIFFIKFTDVLFEMDFVPVLAALLSITAITLVGFFDDLNAIRKKLKVSENYESVYKGALPRLWKALLVLPAAIPLMAINAGITHMYLPFLGNIELGLIYPLFLVPLGVLCVSNAVNMLGGLNGMETGMGAVALLGLGVYGLSTGAWEASLIAFITSVCCFAMLLFSFCPSRFLPGDSATYLIGGAIASVVIIGNMEYFGFIIFLPWIFEAILKASQKFKATSLGKIDGKFLKPKNNRLESLTHVAMSLGNFTEAQLVSLFMLLETAVVLFAFLII